MRRLLNMYAYTMILTILLSCDRNDEGYESTYPDILTEMADVLTDSEGRMVRMLTDKGTEYSISNPPSGYVKEARYRLVCGYVPNGNTARLYNMTGVNILRDSTEVAAKDPTVVVSAWRAGGYINMHLSPLTQGGVQYWGFIVDRREPGNIHISLHHRQNGDPASYSRDAYASLPVEYLEGVEEGDIITLHVNTTKGEKEWNFRR